jgi:hypothetical protein
MGALRLRMEEWPPYIEGSCQYTEYAVADSRQVTVLQLGGWARYQQLLAVKTYDVTKHFTSLNAVMNLRVA